MKSNQIFVILSAYLFMYVTHQSKASHQWNKRMISNCRIARSGGEWMRIFGICMETWHFRAIFIALNKLRIWWNVYHRNLYVGLVVYIRMLFLGNSPNNFTCGNEGLVFLLESSNFPFAINHVHLHCVSRIYFVQSLGNKQQSVFGIDYRECRSYANIYRCIR